MVSLCLNCKRPIHRALYCSDSCRSAGRRLRGRLASLHPSIGRLLDLFCRHAPTEATGYRLLLARPEGRWVYPRGDRHGWRSVDHGLTFRSSFGLFPFEIPSVDTPGIFGVHFVLRGRELDTPPALLSGVWLVPVLMVPSPGQRLT